MKRLRSLLLFFLPFVVFTYGSFIVFQAACDRAMSVQAEKLLPFNHKSHVTKYDASDCELCHGYYDNGRFKGLPTVGDCKMCHDGNTAKEKAFFNLLADIEHEHYVSLKDTQEYLTDPAGWFRRKDRGGLDGA